MPQPKQPLLIGPFPVLFLENMGFDGRSEKGDGHHHSGLRGHQGMRLAQLAQLEGRDRKRDIRQWIDKVMEILRMGSET